MPSSTAASALTRRMSSCSVRCISSVASRAVGSSRGAAATEGLRIPKSKRQKDQPPEQAAPSLRLPTQLDAVALRKQLHARSRRNKQTQRDLDDKLRAAIGLYHLAPVFYPSSTTGRSNIDGTDGALSDRIKEDILYSAGSPVFQTLPSQGALANKARIGKLEDGSSALGHKPSVRDGEISYAALTGKHSLTSAPREPALLTPTIFPTDSSSLALEARKDFLDKRIAARHLPGASQITHDAHLDARGAQLRDAMFGTVANDLPGLEAVRDRWRAREQRLEEERASEGHAGEDAGRPEV